MPALDAGTALLVYGPLGVGFALFAFGLIFSKSSMERERALTDKAIANNEKLASGLDRLTDAVYRDRAPAE